MDRHLCISVRHLTGRYHGEEWPPSPARLFQALLAGGRTGRPPAAWTDAETAALHWLERQPAPVILAPEPRHGMGYRLYVPNNDTDLVAKGRKSLGEIRTDKDVSPRIIDPELAPIHYIWPFNGDPPPDALTKLAARLFCLGWGIDPACAEARWIDAREAARLEGEHWIPVSDAPDLLSVPAEGYLDDLEGAYSRWRKRLSGDSIDTAAAATGYARQPYRRSGEFGQRGYHLFHLTDESGRPARIPWRDLIEPAAWLRHVAGSSLQRWYGESEWTGAFVYGHGGDPNRRIAYVPLPSIGHPHSDASVRRVMVVWPVHMGADVPLHHLITGAVLTGEDKQFRAVLEHRRAPDPVARLYTATATTWLSVTPVVLHGHNGRRRRIDPARTRKLLLESFEKSGYPEKIIADVWIQSAPFWRGPGAARDCRVPRHLAHLPRCHAGVRFHVPVRGPVLAGIGRHIGLGLFAARE